MLFVAASNISYQSLMQEWPFYMVLRTSMFQATDGRDQIFAVLGLYDEKSRAHPLLQPDYCRPILNAYLDTMRCLITADASGFATGSALEYNPDTSDEVDLDFPSWVPR